MIYGLERCLAAYDTGGNPVLMCVKGPAMEAEIDAVGADANEYIAYVEGAASKLLVVTCRPHWSPGPYEYPDDGQMYFDEESSERPPTDEEWEFIKRGDMDGLMASWTDIESAQEQHERLTGEKTDE